MSLYNTLFGENKIATPLLEMLKLTRKDFARFRDVHLLDDNTIRVSARINYKEYDPIVQKMMVHKQYIKHYQDEFDTTFLYILFKVPDNYETPVLEMLRENQTDTKDISTKFKEHTKKMENGEVEPPKEIVDMLKGIVDGTVPNGTIFRI